MVFDLFNEPTLNLTTARGTDAWACLLNGCTDNTYFSNTGHTVRQSLNWQTAGMQQLVNVVRAAGATQPIMLSGLAYTNDLTGLLAHLPNDPANQLAASCHVYSWNQCRTAACWNQQLLPIAQRMPVVTGEFGEGDCGSGFNTTYMNWADANGISYLAWVFDGYGMQQCSSFAWARRPHRVANRDVIRPRRRGVRCAASEGASHRRPRPRLGRKRQRNAPTLPALPRNIPQAARRRSSEPSSAGGSHDR